MLVNLQLFRTTQGSTYLTKHRLFLLAFVALMHTHHRIARKEELQLNMEWQKLRVLGHIGHSCPKNHT